LTANFVPVIPPSYSLTITVSPTNGGSVLVTPAANSNGTYSANTVVAVAAQPAAGFHFSHWSGASTSSNALIQIVMSGDRTATAVFEPLPAIDFTQNSGVFAGLLIDEHETTYTSSGLIVLRV